MKNNLAELVRNIKENKELEPSELYSTWLARDREAWKQHSELYIAVGHQALELGDPVFAFDALAEGLENWPGDTRMQTLKGLALTRCGATEKANAMLEQMYADGSRDEETVGILARTHKDLWLNSGQPEARQFHLQRCAALYAEAYRLHKGYWTGINAATFALLNGDKAQAGIWAEEVTEMCLSDLGKIDHAQANYWLFATLGEAALVREKLEEAEGWYLKAVSLKKRGYGSLASTRRNAALLLPAIGVDAGFLDACLPRPRVAAFTGHIIDATGRNGPRFPPEREQAVYAEIRHYIARTGTAIGFASAACGADILFLEAMLESGGEIVVVLPSSPDTFIQTSVALLPGTDWETRFRKVMERAKQTVVLSRQHTGDVSYSYANIVLYGLAKSYARHIDASLGALAVWDGQDGKTGGTGSAVRKWLDCGQALDVINPLTLESRQFSPAHAGEAANALLPPEPDSRAGFSAELVSILFADVVGFSKFSEDQIPAFVQHFLGAIGRLLDDEKYAPLMRNTWGDGLYFVFRDVRTAGLVGLEICRMISNTDWTRLGFPKGLSIRIGLHSGPVFRLINPVTGRLDFHGNHVSQAARIEPITPPGEVFASQAFAAISEATGIKEFACDYVGQTPMAKNYGVFPAYRVRPV